MATLDSYLDRVTSEHADKPNFMAALSALVQGVVDNQTILESIPEKFDVEVAVGQQLDFTGQWIGLSRNLPVPISDVYFSFDEPDLGFEQGIMWVPGDPLEGIIQLDDDTYRIMLLAKVAANIWDGTLLGAQQVLAQLLSGYPLTHIFIQDNQDMSIDIGITGDSPGALFLALIEAGYLEIRPAGVLLNAVTSGPGPFFGFDTENYNISGFDVGIIT